MWKKLLLAVGAVAFIASAYVVWTMGPRNIIGMIQYDQRREGTLKVGDLAPDVELVASDGKTTERIAQHFGRRPCVLVFGSFT